MTASPGATGPTTIPPAATLSQRCGRCVGLALCLFAIGFVGLGCKPSNDQDKNGPKSTAWLEISQTTHDFGEIPHGEKRTHRFTITNRASQRVRLSSIRNQCTCAFVDKTILAADGSKVSRAIHEPPRMVDGGWLTLELHPGEKLVLDVRVDTTLRPPLDHNEQAISQLNFEPQEAGTIKLLYRFRIKARLRILTKLAASKNPVVTIGNLTRGQVGHGVLELAPLAGQNFAVTKIDGLNENLKLFEAPASQEGGHRWRIECASGDNIGPVRRELTFHTDLGGGYSLPILIEGSVVPALGILPYPRLDLGRFDFKGTARKELTLIWRRPTFDPKFEVGKIKVVDKEGRDVAKHFRASIEDKGAQRWRLSLRYLGGCESERFEGSVEVRCADPAHRSTEIQFTGFAAAGS